MDAKSFNRKFNRIVESVNTVIHGKDDVVRLTLTSICAGGHILFEDVPGVGKSMLAVAMSRAISADSNRIQCTPDMLPGDITGSSIIDTKTMQFVFKPGPVFTNILLVDEVNRATPKTQSALLEAMAEKRVSIDGVSRELPKPFLVLATQNPVELAGTFPLPEAQLDRFLFKMSIGYPDHEAERLVIRGNAVGLEVDTLDAVVTTSEIVEMTRTAAEVETTSAVEDYIINLTAATRTDPSCTLGAGPRASIALLKASKVLAAADGRDMVYAEDVKAILRPVLAHRLMLTPDATLQGETVDNVLERVIGRVRPPLGVKNEVVKTAKRSAPSAADQLLDELDAPATSVGTPNGRARRSRARAASR
jgi:MoxR-like ATPase